MRWDFLLFLTLSASLARAANVSWIGQNGDWEDTTNWSSAPALPGSSDIVSIVVPNANRLISYADGDTTIRGLTIEDRLRIRSGSVTITDDLELLPGSSITSEGLFIANGATTANSASLNAGNAAVKPGTLALPMLTTFSTTDQLVWTAFETDSLLDLSALHTISGPSNGFRIFSINAERGGQIDLGALTTATRRSDTSRIKISAKDDGTLINLSGLNDLVDSGITDVTVIDGAEITWGDLGVADGVNLELGGSFDTSNLTTVTNGSIRALNRGAAAPDLGKITNVDSSALHAGRSSVGSGQLSLPLLTTYSVTGNGSWEAFESDSLLDLSSLTTFNAPEDAFRVFSITATRGSAIDLSALSQVNRRSDTARVQVMADSNGSLIDLSGINDLDNSGITEVIVLENAEIKWGDLTVADNVDFRIGGSLDTSRLTTVTNGSIAAENNTSPAPNLAAVTNVDSSSLKAGRVFVSSGTLTLPSVETYSTSINTELSATETNSVLDLSSLSTINGPDSGFRILSIKASRGSTVDLSGVTAINQRNETSLVSVTSTNDGSVIDLSGINDLTNSGITDITVLDGGEIRLGSLLVADEIDFRIGGILDTVNLTTVTNGSIEAENGTLPAPNLSNVTNADSSSLKAGIVGKSGTLALPKLETYSTSVTKSISASETNSLLDLSSLQTINGPDIGFRILSINAARGGKIDLSGVTAINQRNETSVLTVASSGVGSIIDMTSLPSTGGISSIDAETSSQILFGNIFAANVTIAAMEDGRIIAQRITLGTDAQLTGQGIVGSITNTAGRIEITEPSMLISRQYFHNGGELTIPDGKSFEVGSDYDNSLFGIGNDFNHRVGLPGDGLLLATSAGQEITGNVIDGNSATPTVALGNVHVGDTLTNNYGIRNTGSATSLRGAMKTIFPGAPTSNDLLSGPGVSGNFGPIPAGETHEFSVSVTPMVAGPIPEQKAFIDNNFDNVETQVVTFTAAAYRLAEPTVTPTTIDFGIVHVGDVLSPRPIEIGNVVIADDYSEVLNVTARAEAGAATAGTRISGLAPQTSNNTSIAALLDTGSSGLKNGSIVLDFDSDGVGTSELGITNLPSQSVAVSGQVNAFANPTLVVENAASVVVDAAGSYEIDFGTVFQGRGPASVKVTLLNDVTAPADDLSGTWTTSGDFVFDGFQSFSGLVPGSQQGGHTISISSDQLGVFSGSAVLNGRSENETGFSQPSNPIAISMFAKVAVLGDFDDDNMLEVSDLDLLTGAVKGISTDSIFDIDFNGEINDDDRQFWITTLKGSLLGDADLNGTVDFLDFLALADGFERTGLGWAGGDFDGDGETQFLDFLALANNFGESANSLVSSVPEPKPIQPLVVALITFAVIVCRRNR